MMIYNHLEMTIICYSSVMFGLGRRDSTKDELLASLDKSVTENISTEQREKMLSVSILIFSQTSVAFMFYKNGSIASELEEEEFKLIMIMLIQAMHDRLYSNIDIDRKIISKVLTLAISDGYKGFSNLFDYYIEDALIARKKISKIRTYMHGEDCLFDVFREGIEISKILSTGGSPFPILKFFENQELVSNIKRFI